MENKDIIVYGAYGYTGELIVRKCQELGISPLLSGRNESKLNSIAELYGLPYQVADLSSGDLDKLLSGAKVVVHAAGPFIHTAKPMIEACIRNKVHYTDITGEIAVFELAQKFGEKAKDARVMLLPGTGFDVVPSDCLAAHLKSKMSDAQELEMAFHSAGKPSRGTTLTVIEGMGYGGTIRKDGKLKPVKDAHDIKDFDFHGEKLTAVTIPWGDVSTAFYSTSIPNIQVYMSMPPKVIKSLKMGRWFGWFLRIDSVKEKMRKKVKAGKAGPSDDARAKGFVSLTGSVTNSKGNTVKARIKVQEGYTLTAMTAVEVAKRIVGGDFKPGFQTPSLTYGKDFICEVSGAQFEAL